MNTLKKNIILFLLSLIIIVPAFPQASGISNNKPTRKDITYPNIVKINSLALAFNNISLVYESGILPRLSAGIGVGYKYAGDEPKLFTVNNSRVGADIGQINGFSITPEVRYYIKTCDPSLLEGFYAGLYLRYTRYSSDVKFGYEPENKPVEFYTSDVALNEYGVGIQLGYQLMIKERFSIDFLLFGPRYSSYHLGYEFDQTPSQEFLDDLSEHLNEIVDRFGFDYDVNIKKEGDAKASSSFSFANTRFGISFGFAF